MSDVQTLHTQARKLILTLQSGLERLEAAEQGRPAPASLATDLQAQLAQLQRVSQDMDALWRMQMLREPSSKRDVWTRKVEAIAEETDALRVGLDKYSHRQNRRQIEEDQRQELLQRRLGGGPTMDINADMAARRHIDNSKRVIEEAYESGMHILSSMAGQRDRLKSAHRKMLDVLNGMGLSDSTLRVIERRMALDKLIAYGGMLLITIFVIVMYWWLHS